MTETRNYSCGHAGPVPPNMGRGQAREKRLEQWFSRPCLECCLQREKIYQGALTMLDGQLRPIEFVERKLAERTITIKRSYGIYL